MNTVSTLASGWHLQNEAFRDLCDRYDALLFEPEMVDDAAEADLQMFARVFDVPTEGRSAIELWRSLRPLIARETNLAGKAAAGETPAPAKICIPASFAADDEARPATGGMLLLLAEDDPEIAAEMMRLLNEAGHMVVGPATTARQASTLASQHDIDLALLDVGLADEISGAEVARQLKAHWGVHSVLVSGSPGNSRHLESDAVVGFVGKPFRAAELLAAVELAARVVRRD